MKVGREENFVTQFPDLTEIYLMRESYKEALVTPKHMKEIKTEFVFFLSANKPSQNAPDLGFKCVSVMNNWYYAHSTEKRKMYLYWLRNLNSTQEPQKACRTSWWCNRYNNYNKDPHVPNRESPTQDQFLAGSGCALMLGEPPFLWDLMHRFLTIMRMPVEVPRPVAKELVEHGYRLLDTGELASYWVNGWLPSEYSYEKECKYFGCDSKWQPLPKKEKVVDGNRQQRS